MPEVSLDGDGGDVHLPALIAGAFGVSSSEARRLLSQGGVKLDGEAVPGDRLDVPAAELEGRVIQVGKRRFARLRLSAGHVQRSGLLELRAWPWLYCAVALVGNHEKSHLVVEAPTAAGIPAAHHRAPREGPFSWLNREIREAARPVSPARRSLKTEQRATQGTTAL